MTSTPQPDDGRSEVVGIRTHGSDKLQWAVWTGIGPAEPGTRVQVVDSGELGRLVVAPGRLIGARPPGSILRVIAHTFGNVPERAVDGSQQQPSAPGMSSWGRIGRHPAPESAPASGTDGSAESTRFRDLKATIPILGARISTPEGDGMVIASNVVSGTLTVRLDATSQEVDIAHRLPENP